MALLEVTRLGVTFGSVSVVDDVDLAVETGTIVGLIGPNGAGKTTTIDTLTGFVPSRGRVVFKGEDVSRRKAHERARRGMSRTWQSLELFDDLSVHANVEVATSRLGWREVVSGALAPLRGRDRSQVDAALEQLGIADLADRLPSTLSHGERALVGVARAIVAAPDLLLLDEPAAGLDDDETTELAAVLCRLQERGATIFLIDHDMGFVLGVCEHLYVLDFGAILASGTPAEIRTNPRVIEAYLGAEAAEAITLDHDEAHA